jgi:signal peptidase I
MTTNHLSDNTAWNETKPKSRFVGNKPAALTAAEQRRGKAFLSLAGSMLWPGVGHFFAGSYVWAAVWCVVGAGVVAGEIAATSVPGWLGATFYLLPAAMLLYALQAGHAAWSGRRSTRCMFGDPSTRLFVGAGVALTALALQFLTVRHLQCTFFQLTEASTESMSPAIVPGDIFLAIRHQPIHRWDMVAVNLPDGYGFQETNACRRVVGLPGETVEITGSGLLINGSAVTVPDSIGGYVPMDKGGQALNGPDGPMAGNGCWGNPIRLRANEYYVLGDNSTQSNDSRFWVGIDGGQPGALPGGYISGRVIGKVWPPLRYGAIGN